MTTFNLGINNCFAVKRWPEPEAWAEVVSGELGLETVQHSLDLADLTLSPVELLREAANVRSACEASGITLHSTFTGLAAYSSNLLLHPSPARRAAAETWYLAAIEYTAAAGGQATGGHLGALSARDWADHSRREALFAMERAALGRITAAACRAELRALYVENLAADREPSTMEAVTELLDDGDAEHVPVRLCLDIGHMCAPGATGKDLDPYAWLRAFAPAQPVVHLQQSDAAGDHHWPFTAARNAAGRIDATAVLDALESGGAEEIDLFLEVIPPFEASDEDVLADLRESVGYWREALARR